MRAVTSLIKTQSGSILNRPVSALSGHFLVTYRKPACRPSRTSLLEKYSEYGLVSMPISDTISLKQSVVPDSLDGKLSHAHITGKKSKSVKSKLSNERR